MFSSKCLLIGKAQLFIIYRFNDLKTMNVKQLHLYPLTNVKSTQNIITTLSFSRKNVLSKLFLLYVPLICFFYAPSKFQTKLFFSFLYGSKLIPYQDQQG
jgi:hypothetical protein